MSELPLVRVAVLNWNGGGMTRRCFDHLARTDYPEDRLELVLVDNASTDGSVDAVLAAHPGVQVVQNGSNRGFVGLNAVLEHPEGADHLALVNNDAFVEPGWLRPLVRALEADPQLGAVSPKMVFAPHFVEICLDSDTVVVPGDGRELGVRVCGVRVDGADVDDGVQFVAGCHGPEVGSEGPFRWTAGPSVLRVPVPAEIPTEGLRFGSLLLASHRPTVVEIRCGPYRLRAPVEPAPRWVQVPLMATPFDVIQNAGSVLIEDGFGADRGFLAVDEGQYDEPAEVFNVCGGAVVLRSHFLRHVGGFDERLFLYYEDTDLSWRGRRLGWRYRYEPESVVRHVHGASGGSSSDVFAFHVERNRLVVLAKHAPAGLVLRQAIGFCTATVSYAQRDVLPALRRGRRPPLRLVRNRTRSFLSFLRLLPGSLLERRHLARRAVVDDVTLMTLMTTRAAWSRHERSIAELAGTREVAAFPHWAPGDPFDTPAVGDVAVR